MSRSGAALQCQGTNGFLPNYMRMNNDGNTALYSCVTDVGYN